MPIRRATEDGQNATADGPVVSRPPAIAPDSARSEGRAAGSLARHPAITPRSLGGTRSRTGWRHHPVQDGGRRPGAERSRPRRRVEHHAAEREHVARGSRAPALSLLGRHVPRRAEHHPGRRQRGSVDGARDAEVDQPRPVGGQQHVGGLEVAVHHAAGVDRLQRLDQPAQQRPQRLLGQRPVLPHDLIQRRPWDERGGQPGRPLVEPAGHDRRGVDPADGPGRRDLLAEPAQEVGVALADPGAPP